MNTNRLIDSMKYVSGKDQVSNESIMDTYLHIEVIAKTEMWKTDDFYTGAPAKFHKLKNKKFTTFIKKVYGRTNQWYCSMGNFISLPNGKELYLRYGHKNMASYMSFTPNERKEVLELAPKYPTSTFLYILQQTGARTITHESIREASEAEWKKKYFTLLKKFNTLHEKHRVLVKENTRLKRKINKANRVFETA